MEIESIIMNYIASWNWFILSIILFISGIFSLILFPLETQRIVFFFAFMFGFGISTFMSKRIKSKLTKLESKNE